MDKRNLILVHLESLNLINYRMNKGLFSNLHDFENRTVSFSNYYSSATSTIMVMTDLAYGKLDVNEKARTASWGKPQIDDKSFMDVLFNEGYTTRAITLSNDSQTVEQINSYQLLGKNIFLEEFSNIENYRKAIENVLELDAPIALWISNNVSHVSINKMISENDNGICRWRKGYKCIDEEVGFLIDLLQKKNMMTNSTIVFYGDHGDDIYSHGMRGGLVHALDPYDQLTHTPLFIYDYRLTPKINDKIVSTVDLSKIILGLLHCNKNMVNDVISCNSKKYAFSRNMYVGQRVRPNSFGKAYSVCDGLHLLIANYRGMSMYRIDMDPMCQNNLLLYYDINRDKPEELHLKDLEYYFHFESLLDDRSRLELARKYKELYLQLKNFVHKMYKNANNINRIYEISFFQINQNEMMGNHDEIERRKYDVFDPYFANRKVVLYGAGQYGKYCYDYVSKKCNIVAWVDKNYRNYNDYMGGIVQSPNILSNIGYDIVYLAIDNENLMREAFQELLEKGIDEKKII